MSSGKNGSDFSSDAYCFLLNIFINTYKYIRPNKIKLENENQNMYLVNTLVCLNEILKYFSIFSYVNLQPI